MKKALSIALAAILLLLPCTSAVFAENDAFVVAVGSAEAQAGGAVDLPITVQQNPGIAGCRLFVSYDPAELTLTGVTEGADFPLEGFQFGGTLTAIPFGILWLDATGKTNHTETGELAVLHFSVAENAEPGEKAVTLSYDAGSVIDVNLDDVPCTTIAGSVTIPAPETGGWSFSESCSLRLWTGETHTYVTGLDPETVEVTGCVETTGGWTYSVTPNAAGTESTGAVLLIYDETDTVVEQYEIVMFGDVNGDGDITTADAGEIIPVATLQSNEEWQDYELIEDFAKAMAADVNHDGDVTMGDVGEVIAAASFFQYFNQSWMQLGDTTVLYYED